MSKLTFVASIFIAAIIGLLPPVTQEASATSVLTFEGLGQVEPVLNFYNGGLGGNGSGPGTNFGIVFSANSLAVLESDPLSNFTNEPSPQTVLFFLSGAADTMNVAAGFDTGFSFFYSSTTFAGAVTVYDGPNGTGNVLATLNLSALGSCGGADPFCHWAPIGVNFAGIAHSVDFSGVANQIGFDNITIGSATAGGAVPEPGTLALMGLGLAGLAARGRLSKTSSPSY